jgi:hypothetical protein
MWDHFWNNRRPNQKSLQQINWLGPRSGCSWVGQSDHRLEWVRGLVWLLKQLWVLCLWPWSSGWSGSRDMEIILGRNECQGNTISGNNRVIINVIFIVCQDLEGVVMSCQTLVHSR